MNIGQRIKEVRKIKNIKSQQDLADILNTSRDRISNMELNRVAVDDMFIGYFCEKFNVNEHWLRTGEGDMFNKYESIIDEINNKFFELDDQEKAIMKSFLNIKKEDRKAIINFLTEVAKNFEEIEQDEEE